MKVEMKVEMIVEMTVEQSTARPVRVEPRAAVTAALDPDYLRQP